MTLIKEFKESYDYAVFAFNYDQELSTKKEQFGREIVKFYNKNSKESEVMISFYSDSQLSSIT